MNTLIKNGQRHKLGNGCPSDKRIARYKMWGGTHRPNWDKRLISGKLRTKSYNNFIVGSSNSIAILLYRCNN